jgi:hypothetical protein
LKQANELIYFKIFIYPILLEGTIMIENKTKLIEVDELKCEEIAFLLNEDQELRVKLGSAIKENTKLSVFNKLIDWQDKNSAKSKLIEVNGEIVGLISLSKIDYERKIASIGYWIGSKYWNKGIGKKAFALCMEMATTMGIDIVKAQIEIENIPSRKIWEKYRCSIKELGNGNLEYSIEIRKIDITIASTGQRYCHDYCRR